jgi:hypothetical protein
MNKKSFYEKEKKRKNRFHTDEFIESNTTHKKPGVKTKAAPLNKDFERG